MNETALEETNRMTNIQWNVSLSNCGEQQCRSVMCNFGIGRTDGALDNYQSAMLVAWIQIKRFACSVVDPDSPPPHWNVRQTIQRVIFVFLSNLIVYIVS